jgi:hypothetical protein
MSLDALIFLLFVRFVHGMLTELKRSSETSPLLVVPDLGPPRHKVSDTLVPPVTACIQLAPLAPSDTISWRGDVSNCDVAHPRVLL